MVGIETPPLRSIGGAPLSKCVACPASKQASILAQLLAEVEEREARVPGKGGIRKGQRDRQSNITRPFPCQENFKSPSFLAVTLVCVHVARSPASFYSLRVVCSTG